MLPTILLGSLGELGKTLQRRGVSKEATGYCAAGDWAARFTQKRHDHHEPQGGSK
jgi:hypothetical protein